MGRTITAYTKGYIGNLYAPHFGRAECCRLQA